MPRIDGSLRLGTRGSVLAMEQSRGVAAALQRVSGAHVALEVIRTLGDRELNAPLPSIGGKGVFTAELDEALLDGRVDLAVHSLKDLPTDQPSGLRIACIPKREDPRDALVGPEGTATTLTGLPSGTIVGTSSLRRQALLRAFRPDVAVADIRGNVDTRLRKLEEGRYGALVMAAAALRRLGLSRRAGEWMERTSWLPAPGQGALAIVTRSDAVELEELLRPLEDRATTRAVRAERTFLARLGGGCSLPVGALGLWHEGGVRLWGLVASIDGRRVVRGDLSGRADNPEALGARLAALLRRRGAGSILDEHAAGARPLNDAPHAWAQDPIP